MFHHAAVAFYDSISLEAVKGESETFDRYIILQKPFLIGYLVIYYYRNFYSPALVQKSYPQDKNFAS